MSTEAHMSDILLGATAPFLGTSVAPVEPAPAIEQEWIFRSKWPSQIIRNGPIVAHFEDHFFRTTDPATIDLLCRVAKDEERTKGVVVWLRPQVEPVEPAAKAPTRRKRAS